VYVVETHPVVRLGLRALFEREPGVEVVGETGSGAIALCELRAMSPDIVVIDSELMGDVTAVDMVRRLVLAPHEIRCLVLTSGRQATIIRDVLAHGALGVVSREADPDLLVSAVRTVAAGHPFFDHSIVHAFVVPQQKAMPIIDLRDRRILRCLADGNTNREIAKSLCVSTASAKKYVSNLLRKLEVSHRASAVAVAAERGLLGFEGDMMVGAAISTQK
jgi:DNA-binding NarL/FixJ family response regulator